MAIETKVIMEEGKAPVIESLSERYKPSLIYKDTDGIFYLVAEYKPTEEETTEVLRKRSQNRTELADLLKQHNADKAAVSSGWSGLRNWLTRQTGKKIGKLEREYGEAVKEKCAENLSTIFAKNKDEYKLFVGKNEEAMDEATDVQYTMYRGSGGWIHFKLNGKKGTITIPPILSKNKFTVTYDGQTKDLEPINTIKVSQPKGEQNGR